MKVVLIIAAMSAFSAVAQTREFYGGLNTSNYLFNQEGIVSSRNYVPGAQFGVMLGRKSRNVFGNLKRFNPHLSFEYNLSKYDFQEVRGDEVSSHEIDAHSLRVAVPIQFRLSKNDKIAQFYVSGAPGLQMTALQMEGGQVFSQAPAKNLDLFVNVGGGVLLNTMKKSYDKDGFKFSGLTLSAHKYVPISLGRFGSTSSTMDQYQLNVGLRFSHYKKSGARKFFDIFKRDKD